MNLVFFDFDDTVTRLDTTLPLGAFIASQRHMRHRLPLLVLAAGLARFRLLSNHGLKRVFAWLFLRGQAIEDVRRLAREFHHTGLGALTDDEILGRLRKHVGRGDQVYLISANFTCLLEPLVDDWALAGVIATEAELRTETYTGGVAGRACHHQEKLRRIIARFGAADLAGAVAYGNRDDAPLLEAVGTGYLVRRVRPAGLFARLGRGVRTLSGKPNRDDLAAARVIEPFRISHSPSPVAPADA